MQHLKYVLSIITCVLVAAPLAAQTGTIRGTVTDSASQAPLEGASVTVAGTSLRAETNAQGGYLLTNAPTGVQTVRVQMIGYAPAQRTVTVKTNAEVTIDVALSASVQRLEDVVAVGYGSQTRGELSTAVTSVNTADLANQPVASVDAALQGKAAGVQVTSNAGNPGNAISVRVRGDASVSASNQPLYVLDGVPMVAGDISQLGLGGQGIAGISGLSFDDVENVDVLKDAAAASIYGSRGSNGVVLITTKRGGEGRTNVTFNSYIGTQSAASSLDMLNATEYLDYMNTAAANDGYGDDYFGTIGVADSVNTDWQDAVLRTAPVSNAELAVSGGDQRLRYRLSGTWFDQDGIVIGSGYRRIGGRLNLDFNPLSRLSFSTSLAISGERNDRIENDGSDIGVITNAVALTPDVPVRLSDGVFTSPDDGLNYPNAVALGTLNTVGARTTSILGNVEGRLRITPTVLATSRVGIDLLAVREAQFQSRLIPGTYAAGALGVAKSGYSNANRYVVDNFLTFTPRLGDRQSLEATAGGSVELNRSQLTFVRGEGFSDDNLTQVDNAATIVAGNGSNSRNNLVSFFARANYEIDNKYLFGGSIRTDGSSRFGTNNRWGVFPAVSAAWILSEEPFVKGGFFDYLKLRSSFGLTGNQAISDFPFQGLIGSANYGSDPGLAPSNLANPDLKWETTSQFDLGLDMAFARGRISLSADYYHKATRDLLLARPISSTSGFSSVFDNVGNVRNQGLELALTTVNAESRRNDGFRWSTTLNFALNRNKVTGLFDDQPFTGGERSISRVEVGQPIGVFYTLKFLGVDPATGDAIYQDTDGDGDITSNDRVIVGNPHPSFTGGFTNTFSFRNFDLTGFVTFSQGNDVFKLMGIFSDDGGFNTDNKFANAKTYWRQPGDVTNEPRPSYDGTSRATEISSRFVEDGSYLRMQELTLGYRLPEHLAGRLGFASWRLYLSARNLFTITGYSGYTPDVNSSDDKNIGLGVDYYAYPASRTFTFGVQAGW
jgi:TonB-linked SusC/RagA family outer membrane protein